MVDVVKWDGRTEAFDRQKILQTLLRLCCPLKISEEITTQIEREIYDGITTQTIYDRIYDLLAEHEQLVAVRRDLRSALARMRGGKDFEHYIGLIFQAHGYRTFSSRHINGLRDRHEIDAIFEKGANRILVEIKHYSSLHTYTSFDVVDVAKRKWDDIQARYDADHTTRNFTQFLMVTNTRFTENAQQFARKAHIDLLGWNVPPGQGLDAMIESKQLYPVTLISSLTPDERDALVNQGFLLLKQLTNVDVASSLPLPQDRVKVLAKNANEILAICSRAISKLHDTT